MKAYVVAREDCCDSITKDIVRFVDIFRESSKAYYNSKLCVSLDDAVYLYNSILGNQKTAPVDELRFNIFEFCFIHDQNLLKVIIDNYDPYLKTSNRLDNLNIRILRIYTVETINN